MSQPARPPSGDSAAVEQVEQLQSLRVLHELAGVPHLPYAAQRVHHVAAALLHGELGGAQR